MGNEKKFAKYVSQNVFAMIGLSCYIIADTFFISKAEGANGITILNLALPIYGLIFAIGSMIGIGSATRFSIDKARGAEDYNRFFTNAIYFALLFGVIFTIGGATIPDKIMKVMGADNELIEIGEGYNRIFMMFAPAFMLNYIFSSFIRNDNDTGLAMIATVISSISNIVLDYVFMFVLKWGLNGAAFATSVSPIISILICSIHFFKKKNTIRFILKRPSVTGFIRSCQLGGSAFVTEISSSITMSVFNYILLGLKGNIGIAAYGVVANYAMVAVAIFNGVIQGSQPLFSRAFGYGDEKTIKSLLKKAEATAFILAVFIIGVVCIIPAQCVAAFNSEGNLELAKYAEKGIVIYFMGFLFASLNIVTAGYFAAIEQPIASFIISIGRSCSLNIICALIFSRLLGLEGVWLSFVVAEGITFAIAIILLIMKRKKHERNRSTLQ